MAHYCKICGQYEENTDWIKSCKTELEEHQMCFTCNHWRQQHEWDKERGEHNWCVVDGHHYVLEEPAPEESPCLNPYSNGICYVRNFFQCK